MTDVAQTPGDLIVLSDLHLGRGKNPATGRYHALEAFFFDDDFVRFCRYLCEDAERRRVPFTLVLNGDCFDLLRAEPNQSGLAGVFRAVTPPEGGSDQQLAAIMRRILVGHSGFVRALAHVLRAGNRIVILPGNHDVDIVDPEGALTDLFRYVGHWVEVTGSVYIEEDVPHIVVERFRDVDRPVSNDGDEPIDLDYEDGFWGDE